MGQGNIILLNGTSSSGKTAIAKALQEVLDEYYIHTGLDHYLERVPDKFNLVAAGTNPSAVERLLWVTPDGGQHISEIRIGAAGLRLFSGMYHAYAALAAAGNHLIVDDVIFDGRVLLEAARILCPLRPLFVAVKCPYEVAERREQERGDRFLGLVKAHYSIVHAHGMYDLEVDTSVLTPMECASKIKERLQHGPAPEALARLQESQPYGNSGAPTHARADAATQGKGQLA